MVKERRTPVALGEFDGEMPETEGRTGFWKDQFETAFSTHPGKIYRFSDVSTSTASNLRKDYGLTCATKTENGSLVLYVKWVPEDADKIKQDTLNRGAKRRATIAAQKAANGEGNATPAARTPAAPTGKQTAGSTRS